MTVLALLIEINNPTVDWDIIWRYNTYIDTKEHTMSPELIFTLFVVAVVAFKCWIIIKL